jgi:polyisoprenoid-binding protein YceI
MSFKFSIIAIFLFLAVSVIYPQIKRFEADKKESSITYYLKHPLLEVESVSKDADCVADIDPVKKEIQSVQVQVDVTSFNSGNSNRDSHAMEVIDALDYPYATFSSSEISQSGDSIKVKGKLTFHGISKDIIISALPRWSDKKLIVDGRFNISLTAFKVDRPSLLMIPVEDNLRFDIVEVFNL